MTDVQRATIPHALAGRDVMGSAKTGTETLLKTPDSTLTSSAGSGKTLAFLIPLLESLYVPHAFLHYIFVTFGQVPVAMECLRRPRRPRHLPHARAVSADIRRAQVRALSAATATCVVVVCMLYVLYAWCDGLLLLHALL